MRFPLRFKKMHYPSKSKCAWCKKGKVCEPNSMAGLTGGALLLNRKRTEGWPDDRLDGFLELWWHGAHTSDGGQGKYPDIHEAVEIAKDIRGGQFDIYFCSTKCLRAFLNHAVNQLETKIKKQTKKNN